jgi:hypothetical protein
MRTYTHHIHDDGAAQLSDRAITQQANAHITPAFVKFELGSLFSINNIWILMLLTLS